MSKKLGFNFNSVTKKLSVTSVKFYGTQILAGIGGDLYAFQLSDGCERSHERVKVFDSSVIHEILPNNSLSKLCVFGGREIAVIAVNPSGVRFAVTSSWRNDDWVLSCQWIGSDGCIAALSAHNVLRLWEPSSAAKLSTVHCEERCILYSATVLVSAGRWQDTVVIAGTVFQQIIIWVVGNDSSNARPVLQKLCGHKGVIFSVTYNEKLQLISSTSDDRTVRVWSVNSASSTPLSAKDWAEASITLTVTIFGHTARVWQSCILADKRIVSIGEDSMLCVWECDGKSVCQRETHQGGGTWCVDVSADETLLVTGGGDGGISLWPLDPPPAVSMTPPPPPDAPRRVALLPGGSALTVTDKGKLLLLRDLSWTCVFEDPRISSYCLLELSPSRDLIGLATINGHIIVIQVESFEVVSDRQVSQGKIYSMHWLSETTILSCHDQGQLIVWNMCELGLKEIGRCHLPVCKERWTTSAVLCGNTVVYGDRAGNIHSSPLLPTHYNIDNATGMVACPVIQLLGDHESWIVISDDLWMRHSPDKVCTVRRAHSRLGVSSLSVVRSLVWSTGRDGMVRQFSCGVDHSLSLVAATKLRVEWVAAVVQTPVTIAALCFHESTVVLWDLWERRKLLSLHCGGGHRSWSCLVDGGNFVFAFLKDKTAHIMCTPLLPIAFPVLLDGFHTREVNSMTKVTEDWVVSGGEDGTVRLSQFSHSSYTICAVEHNHLSSVRAVSVANINHKNFLFSAGGRAQMKVWRISLNEPVGLTEIASVMLREERKGRHWLNVVPISDPETRYMDLHILAESETGLDVLAACSDAYLRAFHFDSEKSEITLTKTVKNSCYCMLRVSSFRCGQSRTVVVTAATDGRLTFWNWPSSEVISEDCVHQSGINGLCVGAVGEVGDRTEVLVVTGGDDNSVVLSVYRATAMPKGDVERVDRWADSGLHSSVVTGITVVGDKVICCAGDQRLTLLSWNITQSRLSVQTLAQHCCSIPDLKGLTLLTANKNRLMLAVYGDGMEILEIEDGS